jgi:transcriptional regulator with XRE-family HTH domain
MDADTCEVTEALDAALTDSGLSQDAFAAALGTSASRLSTYRSGKVIPSATLFLRALRLARSLSDAREKGLMTAPRAGAEIAQALREDDETWAFKMALQGRDHLRIILQRLPALAAAWEAAPRSTGQAEWDTLLAALTAHEFEAAGRPAPEWTTGRRLDAAWVLDSPRLDEQRIRERTPPWLAARGVYINERDLVTA